MNKLVKQTLLADKKLWLCKQKFGTQVTPRRGIFGLTRRIPRAIFGRQNAQLWRLVKLKNRTEKFAPISKVLCFIMMFFSYHLSQWTVILRLRKVWLFNYISLINSFIPVFLFHCRRQTTNLTDCIYRSTCKMTWLWQESIMSKGFAILL